MKKKTETDFFKIKWIFNFSFNVNSKKNKYLILAYAKAQKHHH